MDKAAPLGHVVDHVKEQRQRAKEASKISSGVPSEIDEVIVDQIEDGSEQIKSSICCDDRPELFAEIGSALKALEATIGRPPQISASHWTHHRLQLFLLLDVSLIK
ncbi:hypothetical protein SASPL_117366 [Salvia splendens]|uniref:Uncharacterized protein n=1 Tax=Salvia splendens TaxID=180675 RepID=A0A8X8ZYU6_SALSN|nr:hypothetical protein SASPL_117366 [Salvia splendens]